MADRTKYTLEDAEHRLYKHNKIKFSQFVEVIEFTNKNKHKRSKALDVNEQRGREKLQELEEIAHSFQISQAKVDNMLKPSSNKFSRVKFSDGTSMTIMPVIKAAKKVKAEIVQNKIPTKPLTKKQISSPIQRPLVLPKNHEKRSYSTRSVSPHMQRAHKVPPLKNAPILQTHDSTLSVNHTDIMNVRQPQSKRIASTFDRKYSCRPAPPPSKSPEVLLSDRTHDKSPDRSKIDALATPHPRRINKLPSLRHVPKLPKASPTPYELNSLRNNEFLNRLPVVKKSHLKSKRQKKKKNGVKRKQSSSVFDMYAVDQLTTINSVK